MVPSYLLNNLNLNNKFGNKVNDIINEVSKANDVNTPKRIVGLKFDNIRIKNPALIVIAVYLIAKPILICVLRIDTL